jgi:hypothetical protein
MVYNVSKEELISLASRIYEEGCYGYLDLKNSVCDKIISDFLDGKKEIKKEVTSLNVSHNQPYSVTATNPFACVSYGSSATTTLHYVDLRVDASLRSSDGIRTEFST